MVTIYLLFIYLFLNKQLCEEWSIGTHNGLTDKTSLKVALGNINSPDPEFLPY